MAKKLSYAARVAKLKKGESTLLSTTRNTASVTAHRVLGKGRYSVATKGKTVKVTRTR
jgi:hypothetical protein